jgi:Uma2 family endonuclease
LPERHWTEEEFDLLIESGIIREGSSTYLWDGRIIEPMVEDNPHFNAVDSLRDILKDRLPAAEWSIRQNGAIDLAKGYRPQPDLTVIRGPRSGFKARGKRPKPADVGLLVEVSDSTYYYDSGEFLRKYAEAGIACYWIVHIPARRIEVYSDPDADARTYRDRKEYGLDASVPLRWTIDGAEADFGEVPVRDVLRDSLDDAGEAGG